MNNYPQPAYATATIAVPANAGAAQIPIYAGPPIVIGEDGQQRGGYSQEMSYGGAVAHAQPVTVKGTIING
jgi:allophanate hydrolase subunit 2